MAKSFLSRDRRKFFGGNSYISGYSYGTTNQRISITDMISEGPIKGLVNGGKSIYLDNDALFEGGEVPYTAQQHRISNTVSNTQTFTINTYDGPPVDYTTENNSESYLRIFSIYYITTPSTSNIQTDAAGTTLTMDWSSATVGDNTVLPTYAEFLSTEYDLSFADKKGFGEVVTTDGNRHNFVITSLNNTTKTAQLLFPISSDQDAVGLGDIQSLFIHQMWGVDSLSGNTIVLDSDPGILLEARRFEVTGYYGRDNAGRKYEGSGFQFVTGYLSQPLLQTPLGVGSSTTSLPNSAVANLEKLLKTGNGADNAPKITAGPANNASEIDKVQLIFNYPGGLVLHNTGKGKKEQAGAGYKIYLRFDRTDDGSTSYGEWIDAGGNYTPSSRVVQDLNTYGTVISDGETVFAHGGKYQSAVSFTHTIDLTPYQPYTGFQIAVRRITNSADLTDGTDARGHTWINQDNPGKLAWRGPDVDKWQSVQSGGISQVLGIITEKVNYPYTALANVTFGAKEFSDTPSRTYECYGMLVQIPSNYTTREELGTTVTGATRDVDELYDGIWDGTFKPYKEYTDNPAWIFYDILTNHRYGVGEFVNPSDIDKWALYKVARYCDELVPDGKGGLEPRFRANVYLQKATDVYKVLKDMATIFRGMLYWNDGKLFPVIDEKKYPVYNFNRSNVVKGQFNYESTASKTRTNQIIVQWNNPEADFKLEPLIVEDRTNIVETGKIIQEEATAFGCTSEGQAIRYGRWKLWTAVNQTDIVSFQTAINAAFLSPGDVINIQDNHDYGLAYSGRIRSATTTTLTLDRNIDTTGGTVAVLFPESRVLLAQDSATIGGTSYVRGDEIRVAEDENSVSFSTLAATSVSTYALINNAYDDSGNLLNLQYNEGTVVRELGISNVSNNELTLSDALTSAEASAVVGQVFGIRDSQETAASYKEYKIVDIVKEEDNSYGITAVEYYASKFDAVDYNFTLAVDDPLNPGPKVDDTIPPPENVSLLVTPDASRPGQEVTLSWDKPGFPSDLRYQIIHNFGTEDSPFLTNDTTKRFYDLTEGVYQVSIRSIDYAGRKSAAVVREVWIEDTFETLEDRLFGIVQGGYATSKAFVDTANTSLKFEASDVTFLPFSGTPSDKYTFTSPSVDYSSLAPDEVGYIFADLSASTLYLVKHLEDTTLGVPYWYDVNTTEANRWTLIEGAAGSPVGNSPVYINSATNGPYILSVSGEFTTELANTNILRIDGSDSGSSQGALVTYIETDNLLYIDRALRSIFETDTSVDLYKDTLSPDFAKDFLVGSIDGSGNYKSYLVIDPDLQTGRAVVVSPSINSLSYSGESATQYNNPSSITADITAIGFTNPEFRVTLSGGADVTPSTNFAASNTADPFLYSLTVDADGAVPFGTGDPVIITASVREATNTAESKASLASIAKIRDGLQGNEGAAGLSGRTIKLSASSFAFTYDQAGNLVGPSSVIFTTTIKNFENSASTFYTFFVDDVSQSSAPSLNSTFEYTPPATIAGMPQKIEVTAREKDSASAVQAIDTITTFGVEQGSDAYTVAFSNDNHSVTASSDGAVDSADFAGSGTRIDVYKGATQLSYSTVAGAGTFSISLSANNVTAGAIGRTVGDLSASAGDITAFTADQGRIEYQINAENLVTIPRIVSFTKSRKGETGDEGPSVTQTRIATGIVYYQTASSALVATPSASSYNFADGTFVDLTNGWDITPPKVVAGENGNFYISYYTATESAPGSGSATNLSFTASRSSFNFTDAVVFSDLSGENATVIDGSNISTGTITLGTGANLGQIRAGKTNYADTQSGFFLGFDPDESASTKALFHIGDTNQSLRWSGSALQVKGTLQSDTIQINQDGKLIMSASASLQGKLTASDVGPGGVKLSSLSQEVLNYINTTVGTSVGATTTGYVVTNSSSDKITGSTQDISLGTATRGSQDITLKLDVNHFFTTNLTAAQWTPGTTTGTAQFQYSTDNFSSDINNAGSVINWEVFEDIFDFTDEIVRAFTLNISSSQTFTGGSESQNYAWRIRFTGGSNHALAGNPPGLPQIVTNAPFEASVLEGSSGVTSTGGSTGNADTLDGLQANQFLRADANDNFTGGTLTIDTTLTTSSLNITGLAAQNTETTALMINGSNVVGTRNLGSNAFNSTAFAPLASPTFTGTVTANNLTVNGTLTADITGTAGNAETLNSLSSGQFLRSDASDTFSAGSTLTVNGSLTANSAVTLAGLAATTVTSAVMVNGSGQLSKRALGTNAFNSTSYLPTAGGTISGNLTVSGDLDVNGTTTTIDSSTLSVSSKTIVVARGATTSAQADGAGVVVGDGSFASILYQHSGSKWVINNQTDVQGPFTVGVGGTAVLNLDDSTDDDDHIIRFRNTLSSDNVVTVFQIDSAGDDLNLKAFGGTRGVALWSNGLERVRLSPAGYLGINTSTPDVHLEVGEASKSTDHNVRVWYSDSSYTQIRGYGIETNRSTSYFRSLNTGTDNLIFGGSGSAGSAVQDYNTITFRPTSGTVFSKGNVTVNNNLSTSGNITTTNNAALIATRKLAARDTNGLAIATSDGASRVDLLNSGELRINRNSNLRIQTESSNTAGLIIFDNVDGTYDWWNYQATDNKLNWVITSTGGAEMALSANGTTHSSAQLTLGGGTGVGGTLNARRIEGNEIYADRVRGLSDNNTQIEFLGSDVTRFIQGGNEKARIDANGNLGIGATTISIGDYSLSSDVPKLHVLGPTTTGQRNIVARFQAGNDSNDTAAGILINHANDRGIAITGGRGTGDEALVNFSMVSAGGTVQDAMTFRRNSTVVASSVGINESENLSAGLTVRGGNYANNQDSGLIIQSGDATGSHWRAGFKIKSDASGVPRLAIDTLNGAAGSTIEAMVLENTTGFVGIGTDNPAANLHIKSQNNVGDALLIVEADADNNNEADNPRIELRQDNNLTAGYLYMEGNGGQTATGTLGNALVLEQKADGASNGKLMFATGGIAPNQTNGPTNGTVRMTISESGFVGVGVTSPDKALVVSNSGANAEIVINDTTGSPILRFRNNGSTNGTISTDTVGAMIFSNSSKTIRFADTQFRLDFPDSGTVSLGSISSRWAGLYTSGAINFGPEGTPNQTYIQYTRSSGGAVQTITLMQRHTELGATSFGGDDATVIGAGEGRQTVVNNLANLAGEQLHLAAESGINFYTSTDNWSSGWAARNEMEFSSTGILTAPTVRATTAIEADVIRGSTYPTQSQLDFDDDSLPDSVTNSVTLKSIGSMAFIIDSNLNGTTDKFYWLKDSGTPSAATELMELDNDGNLTLIGQLNATTKSFLINHPTKEGMKLRYGSLEGPENGVYVRGRATTNMIELPDYWTGLVDENTITVQLTANGRFQKLFVDRIENNKVYLKNASWFSNKVDCYYNVYGERKDVEKLEVEY